MYQALYRKYRPQTFDDVVGQPAVTETLKAQLRTGRLSHAYLFTGSRGTGKTSCAKILAKAVNCLDPQDGNPCNRCSACRSIDAGACMDVLEIDAASNNGVDNVRALRDDAVYTPAQVKRRVYIIDEVHMLSMQAFNALLKIIEEPPEHLLFILATTELHKVPATILSRCQRFSFRRLLPEDIAGRLNHVAYQEGIEAEQDALALLARLADGALRDGLSLLDQCAAALDGPLTAETVYRSLGLAGDRKTAQLMTAVADGDAAAALEIFSGLYAGGKDMAAMAGELTDLARDLLILKTAPKCGASMLSGVCTDQEVRALLDRFSAGELLRITARLQETASGFARSADRRLDMELCLLELCAPSLQLDAVSLNARLTKLEQLASSGRLAAPPAAPAEDEERPPFPGDEDAPPEAGGPQPERRPAAPAAQTSAPAGLPVGFWTDLTAAVADGLAPGLRGILPTQVTPELRGDKLLLRAASPFVQKMVDTPAVLQQIRSQAVRMLGRPVAVQVTAGSQESEDRFSQLLELGRSHGDIFNIK